MSDLFICELSPTCPREKYGFDCPHATHHEWIKYECDNGNCVLGEGEWDTILDSCKPVVDGFNCPHCGGRVSVARG